VFSASKEETSQKRHKIVEDGYNLGRDWFVERALAGSHWKGHQVWWRADVEWRTGLLEPGSNGTFCACCRSCFRLGFFIISKMSRIFIFILLPGVNHGIPLDGRVAVLTVNRV
jgi:hypothetical protein